MCERCRAEATGLRLRDTAILSKLFGLRACKHSQDCYCEDCQEYRDRNKYADFGWTGSRPTKVSEEEV